MRFGRFIHQEQAVYGVVEHGIVYAVEGSVFHRPQRREAIGRVDELRSLVPCEPQKVLAIGPNFQHPGAPFPDQEPQIFIKPGTSLIGSGDPIRYPWMSEDVIHEPELAVVMGRKAKNVPVDRALDCVCGYTCANDVTARDFFAKDRVVAGRSKIFDSFCPLGPLVVTGIDGNDLSICARVNGQVQVTGHTSQMKWRVEEVVSFISCVATLLPGDVILMAAPGIGALGPGDIVEVEIEGIGVLTNPVSPSEDRPVRWQQE
jgi:2-keto-4-pentenoate hydratase/2-oxohepta-3-ene-1,7-dioic acid hydratase in catechol pathway